MKNIEDKAFGYLTYEHFWVKDSILNWDGKDFPVVIIVKAANAQAPSIIQQNCYTLFLKDTTSWIQKGLKKLLPYCQDNFEVKLTEESLKNALVPKEIIFKRTGRWGITFTSPWEDSFSLAIAFKDQEVIAGLDDLLI